MKPETKTIGFSLREDIVKKIEELAIKEFSTNSGIVSKAVVKLYEEVFPVIRAGDSR